ncbi:MAG: Smr/MutS family protein [Alphaproteobacteria bacterium]
MADKPTKSRKTADPKAGDDSALWRAAMRDVAPLKTRTALTTPALHLAPEAPAKEEAKRKRPTPARPAVAPPPLRPPLPEIAPGGRASGLDKRTAQRLRRGQLAIEARLDLHGLTQAQARALLDSFLAKSQDRGRRCVLVITGKGRVSEEGGVLRAMTPRWLNLPPNRARILAIETAQPKDGGAGALYVLLRRKR